jgi:hypothetical protein
MRGREASLAIRGVQTGRYSVARNKWTKFVRYGRERTRRGDPENTANSRAETLPLRSASAADCITHEMCRELHVYNFVSCDVLFKRDCLRQNPRPPKLFGLLPNWHVSESSFAKKAAAAVDNQNNLALDGGVA